MRLILFFLLLSQGVFGQVLMNNNMMLEDDGEQKTFFDYPAYYNLTFRIWREGDVIGTDYHTNYDWDSLRNTIPVTNAYYVDPVSGNDGNAGTIGSPLKSVKAALQKTDRDIVYLKPGLYNYTEGWQAYNLSTIARNVRIETYGGAGNAIISTAIPLTYSPNATYPTTVWESAFISSTLNTTAVVDMSNLETINGVDHPIRLVPVTSIALCDATANTCYYNTATDILYVHTFDTRAPDSDIVALRDLGNGVNTGVQSVYMKNIEFWGGGGVSSGTFAVTNTSSTRSVIVTVDCQFNYATTEDGFFTGGNIRSFNKNGTAYGNDQDGWNYQRATYDVTALEFYCTAWRNGFAKSGADNGTTSHNSCKVIRVGGDYQYNYNRNVHDILDTRIFNVGCVAGNSEITSGVTRVAFALGSSADASNTTIGYYIECRATTSATADLAVYQVTTAYVSDSLMNQTITREGGSILRQYISANPFTYSAEYQTYLDVLTNFGSAWPDAAERTKDDALIVGMKADGNWDLISNLRRFKGAGSLNNSLWNLHYPGLYKSIAVNSPTFDNTTGVGSNGTSSYINANWNMLLDETLSRNDFFIGVWISTGGAASGVNRVTCGNSSTLYIGEINGVTNIAGRALDGTNGEYTGHANFTDGHYYSMVRSASNVVTFYVDGVSVNTTSTASTVNEPSSAFYILAKNNTGPEFYSLSSWRIGAFLMGSSSADQLEIYNRLATRFAP